jgi:hypothetical protein
LEAGFGSSIDVAFTEVWGCKVGKPYGQPQRPL